LAALLSRLPRLLAESGCALLVLNPLQSGFLPDPAAAPAINLTPLAALRLRLTPAGWLRRGPAIIGCVARVTISTPPFATPLTTLTCEMLFAQPAEGR